MVGRRQRAVCLSARRDSGARVPRERADRGENAVEGIPTLRARRRSQRQSDHSDAGWHELRRGVSAAAFGFVLVEWGAVGTL